MGRLDGRLKVMILLPPAVCLGGEGADAAVVAVVVVSGQSCLRGGVVLDFRAVCL